MGISLSGLWFPQGIGNLDRECPLYRCGHCAGACSCAGPLTKAEEKGVPFCLTVGFGVQSAWQQELETGKQSGHTSSVQRAQNAGQGIPSCHMSLWGTFLIHPPRQDLVLCPYKLLPLWQELVFSRFFFVFFI